MQEETGRKEKFAAMIAEGMMEWLKFPLLFPMMFIIIGLPVYLFTDENLQSTCLMTLLGYCGGSVFTILTAYRKGHMAGELRIPEEE